MKHNVKVLLDHYNANISIVDLRESQEEHITNEDLARGILLWLREKYPSLNEKR